MGNPNLISDPGEVLGPDTDVSAPDRQHQEPGPAAKSAAAQKVPKKRTKTGCLSKLSCGFELSSAEPKHPLTTRMKTYSLSAATYQMRGREAYLQQLYQIEA